MYEYKVIPEGVLRLKDGHVIKPDMKDNNWQYFVRWVKNGNFPLGPDEPMPAEEDMIVPKHYPELDVLTEVDNQVAIAAVVKVMTKQVEPTKRFVEEQYVTCEHCKGSGNLLVEVQKRVKL